MIYLTPLHGRTVPFDERLIEAMEERRSEAAPDEPPETHLLLRDGETKVIEEPAAEVVRRIVAARRRVLHELPPVVRRTFR
jgi:uncharacterized protein YlzI (FlbEa/FlbD family)